jgi:hypothetical protein
VRLVVRRRALRVLDFDIEARPLDFIGGDFVGKEPTVIAWMWEGDNSYDMRVANLGEWTMPQMLSAFRRFYDEADMVTGHFIRAFDLPIINAALIEHGMAPLGDKLTCDTKLDLIRFTGISKSQKNLAEMLAAQNEKVEMSGPRWRSANRLEPAGIAWAKERCMGDVRQHMEMRGEMLRRGLLRRPQMWRPGCGATLARYVP